MQHVHHQEPLSEPVMQAQCDNRVKSVDYLDDLLETGLNLKSN